MRRSTVAVRVLGTGVKFGVHVVVAEIPRLAGSDRLLAASAQSQTGCDVGCELGAQSRMVPRVLPIRSAATSTSLLISLAT